MIEDSTARAIDGGPPPLRSPRMPQPPRRTERVAAFVRDEWRHLTTVHRSDRPWQMPFAAGVASGLPLLIAAGLGDLRGGLVATLGGLTFLYLPDTAMHHRMATLLAAAFAMTTGYTLGVLAHLVPPLMVPTLTSVAILATMASRYFALPRPGSFFIIFVAAIGTFTPTDLAGVPRLVGLISMGAMLACLVGFAYSLHILRTRAARPIPERPAPTFDFIVLDPVLIGVSVGVALLIAQLLRLEKAYWVPVSCLAVLQGTTLRAVWTRQVHRILGTIIGLGVTGLIFLLPLNAWGISVAVMALTFVVETAVVRNYAFAAIFITPLAILLAEAAATHHDPGPLIRARLIDTALGCLVGLLGGVVLHSPRGRRVLGAPLRRLVLSRLVARSA